MRYILIAAFVLLVAGCVTGKTPEPVLNASVREMQTLAVIDHSAAAGIDVLADDLEEILVQGFEEAVAAEEAKMTDAQGKVYLDDYKNYLLDVADVLAARKAHYRGKAEFLKERLHRDIGNAQLLSSGIYQYNQAAGITEETWQALIAGGEAVADTAIEGYTKYQSMKALRREAEKQQKENRRGSALQFFEQLQIAKDQNLPPNLNWLRQAFDALDRGTAVPPLPIPPPEETP